MDNSLLKQVETNTRSGLIDKNNAMALSVALSLSGSRTSETLNAAYNAGELIKINNRPVLFACRKILEEQAGCTLKNQYDSLQALQEELHKHVRRDFDKLIGSKGSLRMQTERCKSAAAYPPHGASILFDGPTGTGKSYIAKLTWEFAVNNGYLPEDAPFISLNCANYANNPELVTATLFGYKKGAFTGAETDTPGLIETAHRGVLFLDEVHCLQPSCQEKLFQFMDQGIYQPLGENRTTKSAEVLLLFATSEVPEEALLPTFLRRIPVHLHLPMLEERGLVEKGQLLLYALNQEQKKIGRTIKITTATYDLLLDHEYSGNIGEMMNVVQNTCMRALFASGSRDEVKIRIQHLSDRILREAKFIPSTSQSDVLDLKTLASQNSRYSAREVLHTYLLDLALQLSNGRMMLEDFIDECQERIRAYTNDLLLTESTHFGALEQYASGVIEQTVSDVTAHYGYDLEKPRLKCLILMALEAYISYLELESFYESRKEECDTFIALIRNRFPRETAILEEVSRSLEAALDTPLHPFTLAELCLSLHMNAGIDEASQRICLIICHGSSTATSMASTANQMLGSYVFDALDMPLDISPKQIAEKINGFLSIRRDCREVVLLVDMGSLEQISANLEIPPKASILLATHVHTAMALEVGSQLLQGMLLEQIAQKRQEDDTLFQMISHKYKPKVLVCSCATGIGTAMKLKAILEDSLPDNLPLEIMTYDYSTLVKNGLKDPLFARCDVVGIVGTLNPNLEDVPFIPVEGLILQDSFHILRDHFADLVSQDDLALIESNILKNFTLSNIIGTLTVLNPDLLLSKVSVAIDTLQKTRHEEYNTHIRFGLYVHTCCLIERLLLQGPDEPLDEEYITDDLLEFHKQLKSSFKPLEDFYHVDIPLDETRNIKIYIDSFYQA